MQENVKDLAKGWAINLLKTDPPEKASVAEEVSWRNLQLQVAYLLIGKLNK